MRQSPNTKAEVLPLRRARTNNLAAQGRRLGTWMILPAQLLLLFIVVFPLLMQIYISLTSWGPTDGVSWIYAYQSLNLFDNYVTFFSDCRLVGGDPAHVVHHGRRGAAGICTGSWAGDTVRRHLPGPTDLSTQFFSRR